MKAIVYHKSGSSEVLKCEEIEKPRSNDGEVPIRVRAASYDSAITYLTYQKVGGGFAAFQCGKALPYREHSKLDRGYAARCAVAAMPHRSWCTSFPGAAPQVLVGEL